jgi:ERF superfamily protein
MEEKKVPLIYGKMAAVMGKINAIGKDQTNTQQKYNFRGIDDVYNAMHPLFKEQGIFMTTEISNSRREERASKSGGLNIWTIMDVKITYWAEDGSSVVSTTQGEAMDSADKGSNKAMAVAHKYSIIQTFAIPTKEGMPDMDKTNTGDPDALEKSKEEIMKFTDADQLAAWAQDQTEWHKNKDWVDYVQNTLKKLRK